MYQPKISNDTEWQAPAKDIDDCRKNIMTPLRGNLRVKFQ